MIFGRIGYLNLLPFHVFMKRFISNSGQKMSMNYKKGVPSKINNDFRRRKVDAAFISSINAPKYKHVNLGIIAKQEVQSVLVIPNKEDIKDTESATSNVLARILNIHGEVLIGDKALKYYLQNQPHIDLALEWNKKHNLPFVFAVLCYHKDKLLYKKIQTLFLKQQIKIPRYILKQASLRTTIPEHAILEYLKKISYKLNSKAKLGLKKFYKEVKLSKNMLK